LGLVWKISQAEHLGNPQGPNTKVGSLNVSHGKEQKIKHIVFLKKLGHFSGK
jgi:hypothetical protein